MLPSITVQFTAISGAFLREEYQLVYKLASFKSSMNLPSPDFHGLYNPKRLASQAVIKETKATHFTLNLELKF